MKTWFTRILFLTIGAVGLWSCEKDEDRVVVQPGTAPAVTASKSEVMLNEANASEEAVALTWTAANYGYNAAVNYTLEADVKGNNFAKPEVVDVSNNREKKFTVAELNAMAKKLGLASNVAGQLEMRVMSTISELIQPVYSSVVTVAVTPYTVVIEYPSLYVPGAYQGWTPATAAKVASITNNKVYQGYVYFPDATNEFKFTSAPNWDNTNYGGTSTNNAGDLSTTGDNLKVTGTGYYLLEADLNTNKWSATQMNWGVVGDATGSWDKDQDLAYDAATKTLKATLDLKVGAIKFRANDAWTVNYGDKNGDFVLDTENENNISIAEAGRYEITVDFNQPGNYTYSLKKL